MTVNGHQPPAKQLRFPQNFLWGVSTSAHQVEGGNSNNQWATWERNGKIPSGYQCGLACDWWRNAERDFDLARDLGFKALRISVEWSRIQPQENSWDKTAIARYRQMLEGLHQRGIRPFISLHHFTNPRWFEDKGAFLSSHAAIRFETFVKYVVLHLGDLCQDWVTFNEPNVYVALGYQLGQFPPGKKGQIFSAAKVTKGLCEAHASAYYAIHELQTDARVGWAQHILVMTPDDPTSALDRKMCSIHDRLFNYNFLETIQAGKLPRLAGIRGKTLDHVKGTCDFVGINYYSRVHVAFDLRFARAFFGRLSIPAHLPQGDCGIDAPYGEAYPEGIVQAIEKVLPLQKPVYILEHGVPDRDDRIRPWVIESTLEHIYNTIERGVDIRGYFHWTLTDNFEWNEGWHLRFGLVELDPVTQQRRLRPSAHGLSELMISHAADSRSEL